MSKYFYYRMILVVAALCCCLPDIACTSAIISGKATADGRPLMWKNRDSGDVDNCLFYGSGEKFSYVAVVNSKDFENPRSIWIGTNEAGFSIMNTLSYNLRDEALKETGSNNGSLMKRALEICATVDDFKHFLDTLSRPMLVCSNYGVIDAKGGASYFEVGNQQAVQYDVNDPKVAPYGYLVRTNYSFSGKEAKGKGYVRYQQTDRLLFTATAEKAVTPEWMFDNLSRSFVNPLMGVDLTCGQYNKPYTNGWFCEQDFIARYKTSCAVAVQGVKEGEKAELTTMWTVIGYPPVTPAVPVWVKGADSVLPSTLAYDKEKKGSVLCRAANEMREEVYSYCRGDNAKNYFNWELLFNNAGSGYMQQLVPFEQSLFRSYLPVVNTFYSDGTVDLKKIKELYKETDEQIEIFYKTYNKDF